MNRFKTKKKAGKDDLLAEPRPSVESESSFSLFRRGKKSQEPETKKEIDLTTALPPTDDFRTSLLMSGLSARFSMLREQDDPSTKIGKASDDSVLYPKRQSRLADFGFANGSGLGDIAEVESIKAPPFSRRDTTASNESGGMMLRSRPLESNVMFGGRQKIYKIAAGSTSTKNVDGMSGRALYDDDVTMSSFQKWRLAEKEKEKERAMLNGFDENEYDQTTSDETRGTETVSFTMRSESPPPHGYNRKRETSSTTSSTPSGGRNSTAATSIVSQPTPASKDSLSQQTPAASANSTPALERHVTRTRRLYEQGLTQDLQEQQHSVLSRVDTLARRPGGARTPELGSNTPSPTTTTFSDRWTALGGERRTVMSKGSAPNLRSVSPPGTGSLTGTMDLNTRVSNATDQKAGLFSPPLSPPISDAGTGEQVALHIQPKDHGKATAMNMFQKPASSYDDSKYAERQRQLQQGRETPTQRFREDSNFSAPNPRSESEASFRKPDSDIKTTTVSTPSQDDVPGQQDSTGISFFDESVESPILNEHAFKSSNSPEVKLERPSDQDHPAFRNAAKSLVFPPKVDEKKLTRSENANFLTVGSRVPTLADSPTLGPNGGLSGMVRQHLRTESDVSSIYAPQNESQASPRRLDDPQVSRKLVDDNGQEWSPPRSRQTMPRLEENSTASTMPSSFLDSPRSPDEEDEFANQLANARRRVREKLTSFVETDATSYSQPMVADSAGDLPPPSRSNPLGILKGKDSRGSLSDRGLDAVPRSIKEHGASNETETRLTEEEDAHPSLRAFRQARRELQKRKELETTARRSPQPQNGQSSPPQMGTQSPMANGGRREFASAPSRDVQHSEYRQQRQEDVASDVPRPPPRSRSRVARDRSGSENSDGSGRSRSRPAKSRDHPTPNDTHPMPSEILNAAAPRRPMMRSPGLPGTDVRGSPILPPNGAIQNGHRPAAPSPYTESMSPNLRGLPVRSMTEPPSEGQAPGIPRSGRFEHPRAAFPPSGSTGSEPTTPTIPPSRRPSLPPKPQATATGSTLTDSMKRVVNKRDISEPTFLMSTSRVPTTALPQSATDAREARSRSGSVADPGSPPPLPPVNPRRKRDSSRTRTIMNGFMGGRRSDESDKGIHSMSTPQLPLDPPPMAPFVQSPVEDRHSAFSISEDEESKPFRRRLRKASSELRMDSRVNLGNPKRVSPPQVAIGPPAGRAVMMRGGPPPSMSGGMF